MRLRFDYNNMMKHALGEEEGFEPSIFEEHKELIELAYNKVMDNRGKGWQEWTNLPFTQQDVVKDILATAEKYRDYDSVVVFGIGGSALGAIAVANALLHLRHNELPKSARRAPKFYVEDNVDPERMQALLDVIDVKKSVFCVITKSGTTSETLAQFMIIQDILKKELGEKAKENLIVITTIGKGTLYDIAVKEGYKVFGIGNGVGGRFSVLSPVGLVPLALVGIDIKALLEGAREMSEACFAPEVSKNPALCTAFLQYMSMRKGKNISVMMPYADSLKYMADFYCQLWGESLGKAIDNNNNLVHTGQTPVKALGVTDQHSQIQLYTEGPFDKVVTFIGVDNFRSTVKMPRLDAAETEFLQDRTLNELINYERQATEYALTKYKRPNFTIILPEVNAHTVGELLQYFMYQTAYCGAMLDIDTYNQPGVEEGKQATFAMMGRKNYENKLAEINSIIKDDKFIIKG
ncbi:MAG TPA: glucose-6-phosphate isomerase [Clostridia bacterium]